LRSVIDICVWAGSSRRRIVSSISLFRALANEIAVPMIANPALCSTLSDLTFADPVRDLGIAINDEAGDAAGEPSIDGKPVPAGHAPDQVRRVGGRHSGRGDEQRGAPTVAHRPQSALAPISIP